MVHGIEVPTALASMVGKYLLTYLGTYLLVYLSTFPVGLASYLELVKEL